MNLDIDGIFVALLAAATLRTYKKCKFLKQT
jgi:hypothetical protein